MQKEVSCTGVLLPKVLFLIVFGKVKPASDMRLKNTFQDATRPFNHHVYLSEN